MKQIKTMAIWACVLAFCVIATIPNKAPVAAQQPHQSRSKRTVGRVGSPGKAEPERGIGPIKQPRKERTHETSTYRSDNGGNDDNSSGGLAGAIDVGETSVENRANR